MAIVSGVFLFPENLTADIHAAYNSRMSRILRPKTQERFDLYTDVPAEKAMHETLKRLADYGAMREFVVAAISAALDNPATQVRGLPIRMFISPKAKARSANRKDKPHVS